MSLHAAYEFTNPTRNKLPRIIPRGAMMVFNMSEIKYKVRIAYVTIETLENINTNVYAFTNR